MVGCVAVNTSRVELLWWGVCLTEGREVKVVDCNYCYDICHMAHAARFMPSLVWHVPSLVWHASQMPAVRTTITHMTSFGHGKEIAAATYVYSTGTLCVQIVG